MSQARLHGAAVATARQLSSTISKKEPSRSPKEGPTPLSFEQRHSSEEAARIREQVVVFAQATEEMSMKHRRCCLLHPEKNSLLAKWDFVSSIALIYTAILTPFETGFIQPVLGPEAWVDPWFLTNRVLDVVFFVDMVLQFFVAYQVGNEFIGYRWVESRKEIVRHYLRTWFVLDAATVLGPCFFDVNLSRDKFFDAGGSSAVAESVSSLSNVSMFVRVLRALRLFKLLRLFRASRSFQRWRAAITLDHTTQSATPRTHTGDACAPAHRAPRALVTPRPRAAHDARCVS